tara:strand:- start:16225 stop:16707 length:483 start_codon:yes stop_codon:yes gene_type:complete
MFLLFIGFFISHCDYSTPVVLKGDEFLVFGHFYGECIGESCVEIFRLTPDLLEEDINNLYPTANGENAFYDGNYVPLSDSIYQQVKSITKRFPSDLHNVDSGVVFGHPDDHDQGGVYVEIKNKKIHRYWLFDQDKSQYPEYFHDFVDAVNEYITLINSQQ